MAVAETAAQSQGGTGRAVEGLHRFNLILGDAREGCWVGDPTGTLEPKEFSAKIAKVYQSIGELPEGLEPDRVRSTFRQLLQNVGLRRVEPTSR